MTDFVSISSVNDVDYYSFTVTSPSTLSVVLTPRGGVFTQGAADQNQTPTSFNANARNNLALSIFGTNGTTVIGFANANAAGLAESLSNLSLPFPGTYYARVTGLDDTVQLYELDLSATSVGVPGDYNHNGIVDAPDYSVWRHSVGQSVAAGSGADGNSDGLITGADYDVWRSHFGATAGAGSEANLLATSVPEPTAIGLLLLPLCHILIVGLAGGR